MKPQTKLTFTFHQTKIHNTYQKKYQAWLFSEDQDFSANFSIWMHTWLATEYWILYQTNTTSKKNWANTSSLIFLNLQCSANTATSKAFTHIHLQRDYRTSKPKRADSTCIYKYPFLYHSAISSLCGNFDMPSHLLPWCFRLISFYSLIRRCFSWASPYGP